MQQRLLKEGRLSGYFNVRCRWNYSRGHRSFDRTANQYLEQGAVGKIQRDQDTDRTQNRLWVGSKSLGKWAFWDKKSSFRHSRPERADGRFRYRIRSRIGLFVWGGLLRLTVAFYEDLKASGFDLIKSDDIRLKVLKLFEDNYEFIRRLLSMYNSIYRIVRLYYFQHFHDISFCEYPTPHDYWAVWTDSYYKNIIH